MLRPIRKVKKTQNRFSVNSQNLPYTIFCESTVLHKLPHIPICHNIPYLFNDPNTIQYDKRNVQVKCPIKNDIAQNKVPYFFFMRLMETTFIFLWLKSSVQH